METAPVADRLTHVDRCDRCGAQAFVRAVFPAVDLLFCSHHGRQYMAALEAQSLLVQDYSAEINAKPSPAAY